VAATFRLLDDQPYPGDEDPLGFDQIARDLAELVLASRASTPLAVGIESGWGMGKSTLMRRLERVLAADDDVTTVWFNAWTADQGSALEGLVKSVLDRLDRNILRRAARNERLLSWARALALVLADWLKLGSLVNTLWTQVSIDPKARNEMRELVVRSMGEWANVRAEVGPERLLVVFVDDLDRCSPVNVFQVFEAIKLYLDAPGLVFIVGYDRDVVSDAILDVKQYSDAVTSHHYLEKIVQLVYRLPSVSDEAAQRILSLYLERSATDALFDAPVRTLTIEQNTRNPRRMKRFINAFILEYGLDAEWEPMGAETLVRTLIIDVYFPDFGRLLRARSQRDPVRDFRDYVAVRGILRRGEADGADGARVTELFESLELAPPAGSPSEVLEALEREVPSSFPKLAQNPDFHTLLDGLGDVQALREKLRRYSPTTVRRRELQGRILIAYRRGRSSAYAGRLHDALASHFGSDRLFMDVMSIEPGADFQRMIDAAVESASVVLAVIDREFVGPRLADEHDFLRRELALALGRSNIRVIPILVDDARMPSSDELPPDLAPLATRNALALSDDRFAHDVARLIDAIEYFLGGTET
jgi:hypothetical protein